MNKCKIITSSQPNDMKGKMIPVPHIENWINTDQLARISLCFVCRLNNFRFWDFTNKKKIIDRLVKGSNHLQKKLLWAYEQRLLTLRPHTAAFCIFNTCFKNCSYVLTSATVDGLVLVLEQIYDCMMEPQREGPKIEEIDDAMVIQ